MTNLAKATASSTQTADVSLANLPSLTHNTVPVLTTELLAKLYGTDAVRIRQGYSRNVSRFIEGKHFYKLTGSKLKAFKNEVSLNDFVKIAPKVNHLLLWTERGAARHAKMLETDQAWDVFEKLEDCYFSQKEKPTEEPASAKTRQSTSTQLIPLRQTAERLIATGLGNIYPDIWKLVHQRFDVEHITQLLPDQISEAIDYLNALEGDYIKREKSPVKAKGTISPRMDKRVLLYLDANGAVVNTLPLRDDEITLTLSSFTELMRRSGWIVCRREDFAVKLSNLLI